MSDGSAQVFQIQLHDPLLVGVAVARSGKVALCVRRGLHNVLIPQRGLLCLGHFLPGGVDALAQRIGFQIGHTHVDAQLLQRLGLTRNTAPQLGKGFFRVQIIKRRHIARQSGQRLRHLQHFAVGQVHAFQHGAHGSGKFFCRKSAHAKAACSTLCKVFNDRRALTAKGNVHHVLHFLQVRSHLKAAFGKVHHIPAQISHHLTHHAKSTDNGFGSNNRFYRTAKGQAVLSGLVHAVGYVLGVFPQPQHIFCCRADKSKGFIKLCRAAVQLFHGLVVVLDLPGHFCHAGLGVVHLGGQLLNFDRLPVIGVLSLCRFHRVLTKLFIGLIQSPFQIAQRPHLSVIFAAQKIDLLLGGRDRFLQKVIFCHQRFHAVCAAVKFRRQQPHLAAKVFHVGLDGVQAGLKGFLAFNTYPRANVIVCSHLTTSQLLHLFKKIAGFCSPGFFLGAAFGDLIAGDLIQHPSQGEVIDLPPGQAGFKSLKIHPRRAYRPGVASAFFPLSSVST